MPIYNKILPALALMTVLSVPAFADGQPGQRVNRGPAPLQAQAPQPPEPGCVLIENGTAWSCPRPVARSAHQPAPAPTTHYGQRTGDHSHTHTHTTTHSHAHGSDHHPATAMRTYTRTSAPTHTTRTYTRTTAPTVTRRTASTTRHVSHPVQTRTVVASNAVVLDPASFSGGVGVGVEGGVYGGGGVIVLGGDARYSGVLSHPASAFTFRQRGKKHRGGGGGCGC